MKHCPVCNTQYDEEILRFCTKDGTPLIDEDQPNFVAMPSESLDDIPDDDFGEETVIRRNPPVGSETPRQPESSPSEAQRIVIPTSEEPAQQVRSRPVAYAPPPAKPNTAKIVFLTILCTLVVLGGVAGVVWLLKGDTAANSNTNLNANLFNQNLNLNTNLNFDANINPNYNTNYNSFTNLNLNLLNSNTNVKTPTPTRTPTPSPSPTASPSPSPSATPARTPSPSPSATPRFPHDPGPPRSPTPRRSP